MSTRNNCTGWFLAGILLCLCGTSTLNAQPAHSPFAGFVEPTFPFITTTADARYLTPALPERNLTVRGIVVKLGHDTYACFDTDLLRMAMSWHGDFLSMTTMAQVSYHEPGNKENAVPRILGEPIVATGLYPGWMGASFKPVDPRPPGLHEEGIGRGPISEREGRWNGLYLAGDRVVFSYTVRGTEVYEQPSSVMVGGLPGLVRTFQIGDVAEPLTLVVGEVLGGVDAAVEGSAAHIVQGSARDTVTAVTGHLLPGNASLRVTDNRYITLHLPAGTPATTFSLVVWRGPADDLDHMEQGGGPVQMVDFAAGSPSRWPDVVQTEGRVAPDTSAFVVDALTLPVPNPWDRNVRVASVDFF